MNYLKKLYQISLFLIIIITFLFGGFLQLFIGIPNTLLTFICIFIVLFFVLIYFLSTKIIIINKTVIAFFFFGLLIVFSGIVNGTELLKTVLYTLFFLLPLGVYWFFRINKKEGYINGTFLNKLFFYIACIQLPLMIMQKFAYPLLVQINQSNQGIISADIMFGSFFLKADHALGFFLLFNIFNVIQNNKKGEITRFPIFAFLYLGLTILVSESNITKLVLFVLASYYIYKVIPPKIKIIGLALSLIFVASFYKSIARIPAVAGEIHFAKNEYNVKKSFSNYNRGIAKRGQVVITYFNKLPLKYFGDGPYSYFNILTGKFTKTQHFSQLIWVYADLGLFGLFTILYILYRMVKLMNLSMGMAFFVFIIFLSYAFMTTIFSDIAIMITLMNLNRKERELT